MQGVEGEAVVDYAEPLTTQQMRCDRLSTRVNNGANINGPRTSPDGNSKSHRLYDKTSYNKELWPISPVVYATLG